jgi:hypothetical protein
MLVLLVLIDHFQVKCLLHFDITSHISHFAIPIVQFISLHRVGLVFVCDCRLELGELSLVILYVLFQVLDPLLHYSLVSVESSFQVFGLMALAFSFIVSCLNLLFEKLGLSLDLILFFDTVTIKLSPLKLSFLIVFQSSGQLT